MPFDIRKPHICRRQRLDRWQFGNRLASCCRRHGADFPSTARCFWCRIDQICVTFGSLCTNSQGWASATDVREMVSQSMAVVAQHPALKLHVRMKTSRQRSPLPLQLRTTGSKNRGRSGDVRWFVSAEDWPGSGFMESLLCSTEHFCRWIRPHLLWLNRSTIQTTCYPSLLN